MLAVPLIAGAAERGTVDYDGKSLTALGLLIFALGAAAVYFIALKRKKMIVAPVVEEMLASNAGDASAAVEVEEVVVDEPVAEVVEAEDVIVTEDVVVADGEVIDDAGEFVQID